MISSKSELRFLPLRKPILASSLEKIETRPSVEYNLIRVERPSESAIERKLNVKSNASVENLKQKLKYSDSLS